MQDMQIIIYYYGLIERDEIASKNAHKDKKGGQSGMREVIELNHGSNKAAS